MPMDGKSEPIEADRLVNPYFQRNTVTFTAASACTLRQPSQRVVNLDLEHH